MSGSKAGSAIVGRGTTRDAGWQDGCRHYPRPTGDHPSLWAADGGDDADGCAVCAAIHQARAPPLAPAALKYSTPAADVVAATPTDCKAILSAARAG